MKSVILHSILMMTLALSIVSCAVLSAARVKEATEATVHAYSSESKSMRFIGISHIAKAELYESIRQEIIVAKQEGYVLYWEYIEFDDASETELRKVRKMLGFVPSPEGHARESKEDLENGYVAQDNDIFLGLVNDLDFNADITPTELVAHYEAENGEILLSETDLSTAIDEPVNETLPILKVMDTILGYRNERLAQNIQTSTHNKIAVLYGALHQKGLYRELRGLDESWNKE